MSYDYECLNCGVILLIQRSIHEKEAEYECPQCSSILVRMWASPPAHFKGSGFYSTDK